MIARRLMLPEGMQYAYNWLANNERNAGPLTVLKHGAGLTLLSRASAPLFEN